MSRFELAELEEKLKSGEVVIEHLEIDPEVSHVAILCAACSPPISLSPFYSVNRRNIWFPSPVHLQRTIFREWREGRDKTMIRDTAYWVGRCGHCGRYYAVMPTTAAPPRVT
jgi:hypothetical protein